MKKFEPKVPHLCFYSHENSPNKNKKTSRGSNVFIPISWKSFCIQRVGNSSLFFHFENVKLAVVSGVQYGHGNSFHLIYYVVIIFFIVIVNRWWEQSFLLKRPVHQSCILIHFISVDISGHRHTDIITMWVRLNNIEKWLANENNNSLLVASNR